MKKRNSMGAKQEKIPRTIEGKSGARDKLMGERGTLENKGAGKDGEDGARLDSTREGTHRYSQRHDDEKVKKNGGEKRIAWLTKMSGEGGSS